MTLSPDILGFVKRLEALQAQRDSSGNLIRDVLVYCEHVETALQIENKRLTEQLRDCTLDLSDATSSRRELQQKLYSSELAQEGLSKQNDDLKNRNPYIMVMIDGDGLIFRKQWVEQGLEGGKKAAYALRSAVATQCGSHAEDVEIVAKVVANVGGLAKAMAREGSIDNISDLKEFTLGFTQAKASFDFIDVGYGKERADSKIKETTRWNLRNHNCKHILLGISHDAGYAPFLDEILQDDSTRQRITVIEGTPTVRELVATEVSVMTVGDNLFRTDKLNERPVPQARAVSTPAAYSVGSPATSAGSISTPAGSSVTSYAGITSSVTPPPTMTIPIPPKPATNPRNKVQYMTVPPQPLDWNPGLKGLDEPITVSVAAMESVKKRKGVSNLCNNHFLRGPCAKGDDCPYVHKHKPSQEELNAIAVLSRMNMCSNEQYCDVDNCIYGHHCPSVRDGYCTHPFCRFPEELHPPGTKFRSAPSRY